jgi:hypothetical protein
MIDASKVVNVYSGRHGCMCGCRGKYSYAGEFVAEGTTRRGYAVELDEVSDRNVRMIVKRLNNNPNTKIEDGIAFLELDTRVYAAYLL